MVKLAKLSGFIVAYNTYHSGVDLGKAEYADIDILILCILDNANHFLIDLQDNLRSEHRGRRGCLEGKINEGKFKHEQSKYTINQGGSTIPYSW